MVTAWIVGSMIPVCSEQTSPLSSPSLPSTDSDYYILEEGMDGEGSPIILANMSSTNVSVSRGGRAQLHCTIHNAIRKTVSWVKLTNLSNPSLLTVGDYVFSQDNRVQVTTVAALQKYILHILYTRLDDTGLYECQVNTVPHIEHQIRLTVIEPVTEIQGQDSVYLNHGSYHAIRCSVKSPEPPHHIFWYFNHQPLPHHPDWSVTTSLQENSSTSVVKMNKVRLKHSGVYECRPSNSVPASVTLIVVDGELHAAMQSKSSDLNCQKKFALMLNLVVAYFMVRILLSA